jgi:hypothetical protein
VPVFSQAAGAAEIEPRAYVNTPVGINFPLLGFANSDGGLATSGSSPITDADLTMNSSILAYARSLDLWGKSGKMDVILPYSELSGHAMATGQRHERQVSGLNDPLLGSRAISTAPGLVAGGVCRLPAGSALRGERPGN